MRKFETARTVWKSYEITLTDPCHTLLAPERHIVKSDAID